MIATIALVAMPLTALLTLVALQNCLAGVFQPASRSAVPDLPRGIRELALTEAGIPLDAVNEVEARAKEEAA